MFSPLPEMLFAMACNQQTLERHLHHFTGDMWGKMLACLGELSSHSHHGALLRCLKRRLLPPSFFNLGGRGAVSHTFVFSLLTTFVASGPFLNMLSEPHRQPGWGARLRPAVEPAGTGRNQPCPAQPPLTAATPAVPAPRHRHPARRNPVRRKFRTFSGIQWGENRTAPGMTAVCWCSLTKSAILPHSQKGLCFSSCLKFVWSLTVRASRNWILLSEMSHCNLPLTPIITSMPG